jgi:hypothetical protein
MKTTPEMLMVDDNPADIDLTRLSFGYYLDLMWPASRHYAEDPMSGAAASLNPEEKSRILGGEACMWSEWVTAENIDSKSGRATLRLRNACGLRPRCKIRARCTRGSIS